MKGPQFRGPLKKLQLIRILFSSAVGTNCHMCLVRTTFSKEYILSDGPKVFHLRFGLQWGITQNVYLDGKMMEYDDKPFGFGMASFQEPSNLLCLLCLGLESKSAIFWVCLQHWFGSASAFRCGAIGHDWTNVFCSSTLHDWMLGIPGPSLRRWKLLTHKILVFVGVNYHNCFSYLEGLG